MSPDAKHPARILAVNAGSSSVKLRVLDHDGRLIERVDLKRAEHGEFPGGVAERIRGLGPVDAIGHRVVHGGTEYRDAVRIDDGVERKLRELVDLAPLHQPAALELIATTRDALPGVPAVACFDTAFHAHLPAGASTYAIPDEWRTRWGLRRYGFHGLSHSYVSRRAAELLGRTTDGLRVVSCHLGSGASLAAVKDGRSVDTTMGFTPIDGLVMATRPGSLDPGLVLWLEEHAGLAPRELAEAFEHRSGLLALAGTADMTKVIEGAAAGREDCTLALDVFVHHVRAGVAAMTAAMDGLDALVFTGGIGENAPEVRERVARGLGFLGVALEETRNAAGEAATDHEIGRAGAPVRSWVVASREDLEIARQVRALLAMR